MRAAALAVAALPVAGDCDQANAGQAGHLPQALRQLVAVHRGQSDVEEGEVRLMAIAERDPVQAQKWRERFPFPLTREYMHGAALLDCEMVDVPDVDALVAFLKGDLQK